MSENPQKPSGELTLLQLLPNVLTVAAICAGLSAIRFGVQGNYTLAVLLIILAGVLDGVDGRLARALGSSSKIGAELDSLADFLNFGVAPPLLLYFWGLDHFRGIAWISVLVFAVCSVMRLARFNVGAKADATERPDTAYFQGVPSPAGALLVMLPMYLSFLFGNKPVLPEPVICIYMVAVGLLLISRIPTWSFKKTRISRENVKFFLIAVTATLAALLTFPWATLIVLCLAYVGMVIWALLEKRKSSAG
ncbi:MULTISPECIES: CDP-diacylglycerol--serine O-phosphatidyltransferase [Paracoccus]|uniref:CDP-diacylglycerol--serine O-phosphatidyltransferase n=1 Tax=Paracoccus litorisediminis TaxID=2006130 RepID=A0A844HLL0_9RHOB|nr:MULTISPECIES: CDP-diacylglycerol--serine O-phosphatidyltransferase [Paracoccus]MBD9528459.1 CDP-diacylglycerol--serine O-phosphatidyltransferase [Paracoccus sp. PAR01]MTH60746.1 CDP-diacylglycerol--serine O-phosphatidyltransferase [Paracoccus litorisediminis]